MSRHWPLAAAFFFAVSGGILAIAAFVSPQAAARNFGIDVTKSANDIASSDNPAILFVRIFGGRNLAVTVAIFAFHWQRMYRAMGILLLCSTVSGVNDIVVTSQHGMKGALLTHAIGTLMLGLAGWGLLNYK